MNAAIAPLQHLHVTVTNEHGQVHVYDGMFATTFDAYDDALGRFVSAARIVVRPAGRRPSACPGAGGAAAAEGSRHAPR